MHLISRTSDRFSRSPVSRRIGMRLTLVGAACVAVLGATACASSGSTASAATSSGPKASPNLITADEISRVNVQNAYEAVQKLRPTMLRQRQVASANGQGGVSEKMPPVTGTGVTAGNVVVYMDGTRLGDAEQLRSIAASSIASVRYFSASEAQTKWGSGNPGGAIEVLTKR